MRCDKCQHWRADERDMTWEANSIGFKRCAAVRERWKIQDEVVAERTKPVADDGSEKWIDARQQALLDARAYVEDGSEYKAMLWTGPDFFCALFEAAPDGTETTTVL